MEQNDSKTVLIARFSALGDVAITIPVLYSACRAYPNLRFVMVTRKVFGPIFQNAPENLIIEGFDVKKEYKGLPGIVRMTSELLKKYSPEVFIDLHNVLRTNAMSAIMRLRGIPTKGLDKDRRGRKELIRRHIVNSDRPNQRERYKEVFRQAGFTFEPDFDGLFGGHAEASAKLFSAITGPKNKKEHWVGIAPFAAHEGKIYPPELMEKVIEQLSDQDNLRIFLFGGGADEERTLNLWAEKFSHCRSVAGKRYGFPAELALMNHLDLMLSMDSGNMHLAAIAGTRVISVWGATAPSAGFTPWKGNPADMIQTDTDCRPCSIFGEKPCFRGDRRCLTAITPDRLATTVLTALKTKK